MLRTNSLDTAEWFNSRYHWCKSDRGQKHTLYNTNTFFINDRKLTLKQAFTFVLVDENKVRHSGDLKVKI